MFLHSHFRLTPKFINFFHKEEQENVFAFLPIVNIYMSVVFYLVARCQLFAVPLKCSFFNYKKSVTKKCLRKLNSSHTNQDRNFNKTSDELICLVKHVECKGETSGKIEYNVCAACEKPPEEKKFLFLNMYLASLSI